MVYRLQWLGEPPTVARLTLGQCWHWSDIIAGRDAVYSSLGDLEYPVHIIIDWERESMIPPRSGWELHQVIPHLHHNLGQIILVLQTPFFYDGICHLRTIYALPFDLATSLDDALSLL